MLPPDMPLRLGPPTARALALFVALVLAKVLLLALRASDGVPIPWSPLLPSTLVYEDLWVVLPFAALDVALTLALPASRARAFATVSLGLLLVLYTAINIPIARALSTPLTAPMLAAVGGALGDSASDNLTVPNVLAVVTPPLAYLILARRPMPRALALPLGRALALALVGAILVLGPLGLASVPTLGVHRNALVTLVRTALPDDAPDPAELDADLAPDGSPGAHPDPDAPDPTTPPLDLRPLAGRARGDNLLVIVLESHGARHLRAWSGVTPHEETASDPTPTLTALTARGIAFTRIWTAYPESIKGLYAALCGAFPHPHTSATAHAQKNLPATCLGATFAALGYRTGLFHSGHFAYLGMADILADRGFDTLADAMRIGGPFRSSFGTDDRATARHLLAWLDTPSAPNPASPADARPFFAAFLPIAGHHPYRAPGDAVRPFPETTDLDRYLNDLFVGDQATALLLDGLASRGLLEHTWIIVYGDHGQAFHEHPGNIAHTLFLYEENLHVPLAVIPPPAKRALLDALPSSRAAQRGSLVDLAPTVHALFGLPPVDAFEGRSLLDPTPHAVIAFTDHRAFQLATRSTSPTLPSRPAADWKLILDVDLDRPELYDLTSDPREQSDLAEHYPEVTLELKHRLTRWRAMHYRARPGLDGPTSP